ncbi:MAG: hypothetical protein UY76_C0023G0008 [Candidatus Uhrbacteria bacterium GW2011_GWA2_52_8d]|uniref:Uncharacterized protein n=1 Tax=Candidatus Uhrbacteria bacterium GW2011_GWA2_52_8d TaxID=1618979 RepID=A0A0G1XMR9_9BACT|nr:MAG: hypothetical protein UY76_C0023G0008 [Candidatus Uhrbacteria bacterium GW2011_GWA2_52_8d]
MKVEIYDVRPLAIIGVCLLLFIGLAVWWLDVDIKILFWNMVGAAVFIGGWLNAYGLATQTYQIWKSGRGEGHSIQMYGLFLFIQVSLALNGVRHDDWMQASGMFASMVPTIWSVALIRHFLKNPRS